MAAQPNTMPSGVIATGYPKLPNRRTALAALAGAGAALSLTRFTEAASGIDPEVSELTRLYDAAKVRSDKADAAHMVAEQRVVVPALPEALFARPNDPLRQYYTPRERDGRPWFGCPVIIQGLREWNVDACKQAGWRNVVERRAEILKADDAWRAALSEAHDKAGVTEALRQCQASWAVEKPIRERIIALQSSDPAALRLKVRLFIDTQPYPELHAGLDDQIDEALSAEGPWEGAIAASILRDIVTDHASRVLA